MEILYAEEAYKVQRAAFEVYIAILSCILRLFVVKKSRDCRGTKATSKGTIQVFHIRIDKRSINNGDREQANDLRKMAIHPLK